MDRILAVIPVHNRRETTLTILENIHSLATSSFQLDILVIDDGSTDGTSEVVASRFPDVTIIHGDGNLWWGGALNLGFQYGLDRRYDFIYTLNDDIVLDENTLKELYKASKKHINTVCSSIVIGKSGNILSAGYTFSGFLRKLQNPHKNKPANSLRQGSLASETLSTQSTLIPIDIFKQGIFIDEENFLHNYSDLDFFNTIRRKGFKLMVISESLIQSNESSSNFHLFLLNNTTQDVFRSFRSIKYAHNLKTQWNMANKNSRFPLGVIRFVGLMTPYVVWLAFKLLLPKNTFARIVAFKARN